jgi:DEAD/DEAH box helicase domain-containing protein
MVKKEPVPGGEKHYGEILVTSQVTGFKRIRWGTMEILGQFPLEMPPTTLRTMAYWLSLNEQTLERLRSLGAWNSDVNNYGPNWNRMRNLARQRDNFTCQVCGRVEQGQAHHVHHKRPFRSFPTFVEANQLDNLVTLCPSCHKQAEQSVRVRTGLGGLAYELNHLAPLFLMCDISDIGCSADPQSDLSDGQPTVILYDLVPAGIGLSDRLYQVHETLMQNALELVASCGCQEGCPSCVGPGGENGTGGKAEAISILKELSPA